MGTWRDDVSQVQSDLAQWVQVAPEWQISAASSDQLNAAAKKVTDDLATARADIDQVLAGK
jgi:hypothetical protein